MDLLRRRGGTHDIWAAPPGGLPASARRGSLKAPVAFGLVVALAVGGAVTYSSMKKSTSVSAEDALAEFQASQGSVEGPGATQTDSSGERSKDRKRGRGGDPPNKRRDKRGPVVAAAGDNGSGRDSVGRVSKRSDGGDATNDPAQHRQPQSPQRPREGVYAWQVEGYEQAPGVRRDLPARSHRVINHEGTRSWVEHHIFSKEKEQWMNLDLHEEGVTASAVRNRVVMGPVEEDNTVVYNPPVFVARLPNEVGRTWKGSWEGKTSGSYTGRTFDHTTVVVQGEEIEVWASEVVMTMRGELKGTATTRSWYSPKYSMVVKQYQLVDVESGPGDYRSEWTGQVLSVTPQT